MTEPTYTAQQWKSIQGELGRYSALVKNARTPEEVAALVSEASGLLHTTCAPGPNGFTCSVYEDPKFSNDNAPLRTLGYEDSLRFFVVMHRSLTLRDWEVCCGWA